MVEFSITKTEAVSEENLRDMCIETISDFMSDEYNIDFVHDVSSDNRRLIYAKVGAALIDYSASEVIE